MLAMSAVIALNPNQSSPANVLAEAEKFDNWSDHPPVRS
jgi:hypothetical protein